MVDHLLTKYEQEVLADRDFLLAKFQIAKKIVTQLSSLEKALKPCIEFNQNIIPEKVLRTSAKISKGENYQHLPYFVLDYPRAYGKQNVFAFRCMVWWGSQISYTLHLSGEYLQKFDIRALLEASDFYFCIKETPWEYYNAPDNFISSEQLTEEIISHQIASNQFIKIAHFKPITDLFQISSDGVQSFERFLKFVS